MPSTGTIHIAGTASDLQKRLRYKKSHLSLVVDLAISTGGARVWGISQLIHHTRASSIYLCNRNDSAPNKIVSWKNVPQETCSWIHWCWLWASWLIGLETNTGSTQYGGCHITNKFTPCQYGAFSQVHMMTNVTWRLSVYKEKKLFYILVLFEYCNFPVCCRIDETTDMLCIQAALCILL